MRNSRTERIVDLIYLLWMLFMAYYWLSVFTALDQNGTRAWWPAVTSVVLVIAYAIAALRMAGDALAVLLVLLFLHDVFFSRLVLSGEPACSCYIPSFADLVPCFISMGMTAILFVSKFVRRTV